MKMFNLTALMTRWNVSEERAFYACAAAVLTAIVVGYAFDLHVFGIGVAVALYYVLEAVERLIRSDGERKTRALEGETRQHVRNVLSDFAGRRSPCGDDESDETHAAMKRVVEDFIQIYQNDNGDGNASYMNNVIDGLRLDERGDDMSFLTEAADNLFSASSPATWEHVATLLCFAVLVCQDLMRERDAEQCVELVGREISTYLLSNHRDWLLQNNAWDGFVDHFRNVTLPT